MAAAVVEETFFENQQQLLSSHFSVLRDLCEKLHKLDDSQKELLKQIEEEEEEDAALLLDKLESVENEQETTLTLIRGCHIRILNTGHGMRQEKDYSLETASQAKLAILNDCLPMTFVFVEEPFQSLPMCATLMCPYRANVCRYEPHHTQRDACLLKRKSDSCLCVERYCLTCTETFIREKFDSNIRNHPGTPTCELICPTCKGVMCLYHFNVCFTPDIIDFSPDTPSQQQQQQKQTISSQPFNSLLPETPALEFEHRFYSPSDAERLLAPSDTRTNTEDIRSLESRVTVVEYCLEADRTFLGQLRDQVAQLMEVVDRQQHVNDTLKRKLDYCQQYIVDRECRRRPRIATSTTVTTSAKDVTDLSSTTTLPGERIKRPLHCSICGQLGHNKNGHKKLIPIKERIDKQLSLPSTTEQQQQ